MHLLNRILLFVFTSTLICLNNSCVNNSKIVSRNGNSQNLNSKQNADETISLFIKPFQDSLHQEMDLVLCQSAKSFIKGQPESELGNLISDIVLWTAQKEQSPFNNSNPQIVVLNNGGMRASLPKGAITKGKIFELMPFENELVCVTIDEIGLKDLIDYIVNSGGVPIAGFKLIIREKMFHSITIDGQTFNSENIDHFKGSINLITSDYLWHGGDKMNFLSRYHAEPFKLKFRDALINYFIEQGKQHKVIEANLDERIVIR